MLERAQQTFKCSRKNKLSGFSRCSDDLRDSHAELVRVAYFYEEVFFFFVSKEAEKPIAIVSECDWLGDLANRAARCCNAT